MNQELAANLELLHPDAFGWALHCCGGEVSLAEEVLQTAYLKLAQERASFDGRSAFKTWWFGVIRLTAREEFRRLRYRESLANPQALDPFVRGDDAGRKAEGLAPGIGGDALVAQGRDDLLQLHIRIEQHQPQAGKGGRRRRELRGATAGTAPVVLGLAIAMVRDLLAETGEASFEVTELLADGDRVEFLRALANLPQHPESVPINELVAVKGTPLADALPLDPLDFVRTIAVARILMPQSYVRLSAGRTEMSDETQTLCFFAGANSIFYGERLLTTTNPQNERDRALFAKLGIHNDIRVDGGARLVDETACAAPVAAEACGAQASCC